MPRRKFVEPNISPGAETAAGDFEKSQRVVAELAQPVSREKITRERMPFNNFTKKMDVYLPPDGELVRDYHLHKFVDRGGRIDRAKAAGYEFVYKHEVAIDNENVANREHGMDDVVSWISGTSEKGDAEVTYLMKIRKEYWDEDQAAIQAQVDATDAAIRRGTIGNTQKSYVKSITYDSRLTTNERS